MNEIFPDLSRLEPLLLAYAKPHDRDHYRLLFALDRNFGSIIRRMNEPLLAQMRLAWWRESLTGAPETRPVGEPLLAQLGRLDEEEGDLAATAAAMAGGWEQLIEPQPWSDTLLRRYAEARGGALFAHFARRARIADGELRQLGAGWALWDLGRHCSDAASRESARALAAALLGRSAQLRPPRRLRPLSMLVFLARSDVMASDRESRVSGLGRAARLIWHGLTGR